MASLASPPPPKKKVVLNWLFEREGNTFGLLRRGVLVVCWWCAGGVRVLHRILQLLTGAHKPSLPDSIYNSISRARVVVVPTMQPVACRPCSQWLVEHTALTHESLSARTQPL